MKINRKKSIKSLITDLGYKEYLDQDVLKTLKNKGEVNVEVELFTLGKYVTNEQLTVEYASRNLTPDVGAMLTYLIENPAILDKKTWIATGLSNSSYVSVDRWGGERLVSVSQRGGYWGVDWWFAGVRKVSAEGSATVPSSDTLPSALPDTLVINNVTYVRKE